MKVPEWRNCSIESLWHYIAWFLAKNSVETVLVGGAVASIYSDGAYISGDLDIVLRTLNTKQVPELMRRIGFVQEGRHFRHPECHHLFVEFLSGPVAIGDNYKIIPRKLSVEGCDIYTLTTTDCICDRLASYIHFQARECLEQARLVANRQHFERIEVKAWCAKEGRPDVFEEFEG